jgi:hypothetical protein
MASRSAPPLLWRVPDWNTLCQKPSIDQPIRIVQSLSPEARRAHCPNLELGQQPALAQSMQRISAAAATKSAAGAFVPAPISSSIHSRFFAVSIPSLPLPPTPPDSKWLPIQTASQTGLQSSKPRWLERPNGAPLPFLSHSLEKVVLAGTKPQLIEKMTTEEGKAYPDRCYAANLSHNTVAHRSLVP